jgi:hypothetical protein
MHFCTKCFVPPPLPPLLRAKTLDVRNVKCHPVKRCKVQKLLVLLLEARNRDWWRNMMTGVRHDISDAVLVTFGDEEEVIRVI